MPPRPVSDESEFEITDIANSLQQDILSYWRAFQSPRCGTTFGKRYGLRRHMEETGKSKHGPVLPMQPRVISHNLKCRRIERLQAAKGIDAIRKASKGLQSGQPPCDTKQAASIINSGRKILTIISGLKEFTYSTIEISDDSEPNKTQDKTPTPSNLNTSTKNMSENYAAFPMVSDLSNWDSQDVLGLKSSFNMDSPCLVKPTITMSLESFINSMRSGAPYHAPLNSTYKPRLNPALLKFTIDREFIFSDSEPEGQEGNPQPQFDSVCQEENNALLFYGGLDHTDIRPGLGFTSGSRPSTSEILRTDYHGTLPITRT